jgi:hypothetical protein
MKTLDVKKLKTIEIFLLNNNMIGFKYLQCKRTQKNNVQVQTNEKN